MSNVLNLREVEKIVSFEVTERKPDTIRMFYEGGDSFFVVFSGVARAYFFRDGGNIVTLFIFPFQDFETDTFFNFGYEIPLEHAYQESPCSFGEKKEHSPFSLYVVRGRLEEKRNDKMIILIP